MKKLLVLILVIGFVMVLSGCKEKYDTSIVDLTAAKEVFSIDNGTVTVRQLSNDKWSEYVIYYSEDFSWLIDEDTEWYMRNTDEMFICDNIVKEDNKYIRYTGDCLFERELHFSNYDWYWEIDINEYEIDGDYFVFEEPRFFGGFTIYVRVNSNNLIDHVYYLDSEGESFYDVTITDIGSTKVSLPEYTEYDTCVERRNIVRIPKYLENQGFVHDVCYLGSQICLKETFFSYNMGENDETIGIAAGHYELPAGYQLPDYSHYSEYWGIALTDYGNKVHIVYIHEDSPFLKYVSKTNPGKEILNEQIDKIIFIDDFVMEFPDTYTIKSNLGALGMIQEMEKTSFFSDTELRGDLLRLVITGQEYYCSEK